MMRDTYNDQPEVFTPWLMVHKVVNKILKSSQHERDHVNHDKFQFTKYLAEIA